MRLQIGCSCMSTRYFARWIIPFGETKVHQDTVTGLVVEQEVGRLDVSVHNAASVTVVESSKEATHVLADVWWIQISEE